MNAVKRRLRGLALSTLCLSSPLLAEEPDEATYFFDPIPYLGARVGYIELEDVDDEGSYNIGLLGGVFFFSRLAAEASLDFQENEFATDDVSFTFVELERRTTALQLGLSFMPFPYYPFRPYVLGGVGYYYSRYTSDFYPEDKVSDEGYFAGFGFDFIGTAWDDPVSLTLEARWLFTQKEEYAQQKIDADGFTVSFGVRWKFSY